MNFPSTITSAPSGRERTTTVPLAEDFRSAVAALVGVGVFRICSASNLRNCEPTHTHAA